MAIKFINLISFLLVLLANGELDPDGYSSAEVANFISELKQFTSKSANILCTLTVQPVKSIHPQEEAATLHTAIKNEATDKIIKIISHRSLIQRLEIASAFKNVYKENLADEISHEKSSEFKKLISGLLLPPWQYHAKELHDAIDGWGTDENAIIDTLVPMSSSAANLISGYYKRKYQISLLDDIKGDTSGYFQSLLVSLSAGVRTESNVGQHVEAAEAAQNLHKYKNEATFNSVLATKSFPELRKIFVEYKKISGNDINEDIGNNFSHHLKHAYLAIVDFARSEPGYFAKLINKSLKEDDKYRLIRVLVGRFEIDLGNIKLAYEEIYGIPLADKIKELYKEGDFMKLVLALLGH